jgi:hypothetical protein
MDGKTPVSFDSETILELKEILDYAWGRLQPTQQTMALRTTIAERIFKVAAHGERDRDRLLDAALDGLGA